MSLEIYISITDQRLNLIDSGEVTASFLISSAANGIGCEEGSYCTPTGKFEVSEMIGANEPLGTHFKGRKPVGVWTPEIKTHDDLVLTRILWLDGLEAHNANTKERYIYIHGTNQEHLIGTPASCGCIRMKNADIIDLFNRVAPSTKVTIA